MRWKERKKPNQPKQNDERVINKFMWEKIQFGDYIFWLETIKVKQIYLNIGYVGGSWFITHGPGGRRFPSDVDRQWVPLGPKED